MKTETNPSEQTLGDLVTASPVAAKILHRYGLDFCCGGNQSFEQACAAASLVPDRVLAEIQAASESVPTQEHWDRVHPSELINHILTRFHEPLRRELPRLIGLARRTEEVHAEHAECPRGLGALLTHVHEAVKNHLTMEEEMLFPMILAGHNGQVGAPIQALSEEHLEHGENLARIRKTARGFEVPEGACTTWRSLYLGLEELERDLMEHIHLENNILFPRALDAGS